MDRHLVCVGVFARWRTSRTGSDSLVCTGGKIIELWKYQIAEWVGRRPEAKPKMRRLPAGTWRSLLTSCPEWPSSPPSWTTAPPWVELPCCPAASRPPLPFLELWSLTGELQREKYPLITLHLMVHRVKIAFITLSILLKAWHTTPNYILKSVHPYCNKRTLGFLSSKWFLYVYNKIR